MANLDKPLLHICHAPADHAWVYGRMVYELGLRQGQYHTRDDDSLGELQLQEIARAVDECRFTVLIASSAARWDKLAQFAAALAQHSGWEQQAPRLVIVARDFALGSGADWPTLSLGQRALIGLDCSDESHTVEAMARLRKLLAPEVPINEPIDERPDCPYPGLARFTAANRDLLFGRDRDKDAILSRIRGCHTRILVVGPSGSGKSSLIHAAVLPELSPGDHVVRIVSRGGDLAAALRATIDALEFPELGAAVDEYLAAVRRATDAQIEQARARLRSLPVPDMRRRIIVVDPLEEIFAEDDAAQRETLFTLLGGLWSLPWCTMILCMRADFYGALMIERCWRELETSQYPVAPLDEAGLHAAIVEPARHAGVHVDATLVERLIREIDRDRSSVPLPLLQVALKELWAHLRWRYLMLADYDRIVNYDQRGLAAVLAVHAEGVVQALTGPGDRAVAQRILLDLVHLGEGRPHTRRRRTLEDLRRSGDHPEQLERVLDKLADSRLITTNDGVNDNTRSAPERLGTHPDRVHDTPTRGRRKSATRLSERHVDLAHDTLITGWPMLADWIAEHRDMLRTQRRLEARAEAGGLLDSNELPEFTHWIEWTATPAGQALGASKVLRALVQRSVAARRGRRGALGAGVVAVTAIAIIFGFQTQALSEEKTKTQQSISEAAKVARGVVFEIDTTLETVAGASSVRERLLKLSRELLTELNKLGKLSDNDQRIETFGKVAQAGLALERGHLEQAQVLYREVLTDAQQRAATDPTNTAWQSDLAISYEKLGEVAVAAGKLDDARNWFTKTLAVRRTLAATAPSNTTWQRDLSSSYERLGDVAMVAGKLDDARNWYDRDLAIAKTLADKDPANAKWQRDLSKSCQKLGEIAVAAGRLDDARVWFTRALAVHQSLVATDPANTTWQRDLSVAYEKLGDVAVAAGKLNDARAWFDKSLTVAKILATADPANTTWQRDLSVSYEKLGDVAVAAGKLDDARAWFDKSLTVAKILAAADPSNTTWQSDLAVSYEKLGDVVVSAGKLDDAQTWFTKALAIRNTLTAADPSNTTWQRNLWVSYGKLGEVTVTAGKLDDARAWFTKALAVATPLATITPSSTDWQRNLEISYSLLGHVAEAAGKLDDARAWFDKGLAITKPLVAADPSNTIWQRDLSVFYNQLGIVAMSAGKLDDARAWFDKDLMVTKILATADPANTDWQRDLSISYARLGDIAVSAGNLDDARAWFDKALLILNTLTNADPSNTDWQTDLSLSYEKLGDVTMAAGKIDDARAWFTKALAVRNTLAATDLSNTEWQRNLSDSYEKQGEVAMSDGKLNDAYAWFTKALAVRNALATAEPYNTNWQRNVSASYHKLGDLAVAARKVDDARAWFTKALAVRNTLAVAEPSNAGWQRDLCTTLAKIAQVTRDPNEATQYLGDAHTIYRRLQQNGLFQHDVKFAQLGTTLKKLAARSGTAPKR